MARGQIKDLDIILPRPDYLTFTARGDGIKYRVKLFIPSAVALLIMHRSETIQAGGREANDLLFGLVSIIAKRDFPHMTKEWLEKNVAAGILYKIASSILATVSKYFEREIEKAGEMQAPAQAMEFAPILSRIVSTYGLTPAYVLNEMTFPQVIQAYREAIAITTGHREKAEEPEETEEEIRAKFKKINGRWR